ncbi:hypothetical protein Taro_014130 [Colocasia esculenta]|uniref:Uncharacterized protein n=1 Tax=Colocasia esculenta TaxID=4460 RepID=A0A843UKW0_COLES|nr:hypothetical protein [Colocasia esculenta]
MADGDDWLSPDKFQHLLGCLLIALLSAAVLGRSRHRFLRRWRTQLGCIVSLAVGAAKEAGDELGYWESSGGSFKDGVADALGVLIAATFLSMGRRSRVEMPEQVDHDREISMV